MLPLITIPIFYSTIHLPYHIYDSLPRPQCSTTIVYYSETKTAPSHKQRRKNDHSLHHSKKAKKRKSRRHIYQLTPTNHLPPTSSFHYFPVNFELSRTSSRRSYISLLYNSYLISVPHFYC